MRIGVPYPGLLFSCVIMAATLPGCTDLEMQQAQPSSADPCNDLIEAVIAAGSYRASQIAGCGEGQGEAARNLTILRLNAHCREEICGSVLLGWYAVETGTGRVWEWDIGEEEFGREIPASPD